MIIIDGHHGFDGGNTNLVYKSNKILPKMHIV